MAETTKIEWADSTWSPWWGCTEISEECQECYARNMTHGAWGNFPRKRTSPKYWRDPIYWNADAPRFEREHGHRQLIFGGHICDWFDNQADPQWRADAWKLIRATPNLVWLILTKRPQNISKMLRPDWGDGYPNVWLGISAGNQHYYVQRWPILAAIPAVKRFVSYEPALGPLGAIDIVGDVDFALCEAKSPDMMPDLIIVGGESGDNPRAMDPQWARDVRDQCRALGVAFFMKQMTGRAPIPPDLAIRQFPTMERAR